MRIALIGYGKMGRSIERLALDRGHEISYKIDLSNQDEIGQVNGSNTDVAIEFSQPQTAFINISTCIRNGVKVIAGTTGWLDRLPDVEKLTRELDGTFLYSANYSLGVNIFFELNEWLAEKLGRHTQYQLSMEEIHHTEKLDAPSGTAIRLAEGIQDATSTKSGWTNDKTTDQTKIGIISKREPNVPGTHTVKYATEMETIEIKHTALERDVFASGAVDVAEWIQGQSGVLSINDFLNTSK